MKIASCVLTYKGADIIDDVLANCVEYYYEEGIDIYYFDASVDDSTKQIIDKYRANGYTNLYHLHMPDASSLDRTTKMMSGELFNKKYDYIWPSKNRSYLSKEGIRDILQVIRMKPDVVVCMPDDNDQTAIIQYTDPVQLYHDTAWIMTSLDTVLYKKDTIFDNYKTQEYYVGFNEFYSYVSNNMPCMKELNAIVASADVGLMVLANVPAFYYGTSPNKFFDYISSGLAVLNNYPGWLADMIEENELGVVVPPNNAKAFADGLIKLVDNDNYRMNAGQNARRFAEANFSRIKLADDFVSFLEEISSTD